MAPHLDRGRLGEAAAGTGALHPCEGLGPRLAGEDDLGDTTWRQTSQQLAVQERRSPRPGFPPTPRPHDPSDSGPLGLGERGKGKARRKTPHTQLYCFYIEFVQYISLHLHIYPQLNILFTG